MKAPMIAIEAIAPIAMTRSVLTNKLTIAANHVTNANES